MLLQSIELFFFPAFPVLFSVKQLTEKERKKKHLADGCFLLEADVNVPLGIFEFEFCQVESVFSAAARNH